MEKLKENEFKKLCNKISREGDAQSLTKALVQYCKMPSKEFTVLWKLQLQISLSSIAPPAKGSTNLVLFP
jgi:hypothetical protein